MDRKKDHEDIRACFSLMNDLFVARKFDEAAEVLKNLDLENMSTTVIIAWMTTACWPRNVGDDFPIARPFLQRCWDVVRSREGDMTDSILRGLDP